MALGRPKTAPRRPKTAPRRPKRAPRRLQDAPKTAQEAPKRPPRRLRDASRSHLGSRISPGSLPGASRDPPGPFREASRGLSGSPCGGFSVALQRREYCKKCSPNRACMVSSWIPPHCPCFPHYFLGLCLVLYELMLGTLWNLQSQRAGFIVIASISPSLAPFPLHFLRWPLGFLWLPMDFHGFSSPHCAPHFFRWPFGFLWLPMDSYGCAPHFFGGHLESQ